MNDQIRSQIYQEKIGLGLSLDSPGQYFYVPAWGIILC